MFQIVPLWRVGVQRESTLACRVFSRQPEPTLGHPLRLLFSSRHKNFGAYETTTDHHADHNYPIKAYSCYNIEIAFSTSFGH
jgi:hypothetical protein